MTDWIIIGLIYAAVMFWVINVAKEQPSATPRTVAISGLFWPLLLIIIFLYGVINDETPGS